MNHWSVSRREFVRHSTALGTAAAVSGWLSRSAEAKESSTAELNAEDVVLFQGDSITDAGRDKKRQGPNDPHAFGFGYASMIAASLLGAHSSLKLRCYNRGISGNKVPQLDERWQTDCLDLKPNVLSILIGVNDIWHKLNGRYAGTVEDYENGFASLLKRTRQALPEITLVVCEPFVLRCGAINDKWFPEFDERRAAAKRVADTAGTIWVPFQSMFDQAVSDATPAKYWAGDGVHPTMAGHALMAQTWLETTGLG